MTQGKTLRSYLGGLLHLAAVLALTTGCMHSQKNESSPNNWPQFRGPNALPVSDNPQLPDTWSTTENVEWVSDVPGVGWSSPIVWGGKIFVTSAMSESPLKAPYKGG
jgi:hypothetical protein